MNCNEIVQITFPQSLWFVYKFYIILNQPGTKIKPCASWSRVFTRFPALWALKPAYCQFSLILNIFLLSETFYVLKPLICEELPSSCHLLCTPPGPINSRFLSEVSHLHGKQPAIHHFSRSDVILLLDQLNFFAPACKDKTRVKALRILSRNESFANSYSIAQLKRNQFSVFANGSKFQL